MDGITFGMRNVVSVAAIPFNWMYDGMLGQFDAPSLWDKAQWRQAARCAEHDHWFVFLVFRRGLYLIARQLEGNALALVRDIPEVQGAPIDHDLPAADAKKPAEIDHRGACAASAINDHVYDPAHVLARRTADIAAENSVGIHSVDHCN